MITGFFDGASRGNPGEAGAGALLQDEQGKTLWEDCAYLGNRTNNEAEYEGLLLLLREIARRNLREVRIYGDSKLVISQMKGEWKVRQPHLQLLWESARQLEEGRRLRYAWVPRKENSQADALSNKALDERGNEGDPADPSGALPLPEGFLEVGASAKKGSGKEAATASGNEKSPVSFTKVGEYIYLARGSEEYAVDLLHGACTCPGFQFRKQCRHLQEARKRFGKNGNV
ncbi:MAG TPA: ribonuclease HI family protein [Synergistaceae bacterium]|nr:ribonuclease HI family protein [Synergistaceae bacterium]HPJ25030.1 ribonuclease HI family protein [Synergistaceae bacterium]HPQ36685.1 ribonuclease HI family protein [Synergistaceae bacterium]